MAIIKKNIFSSINEIKRLIKKKIRNLMCFLCYVSYGFTRFLLTLSTSMIVGHLEWIHTPFLVSGACDQNQTRKRPLFSIILVARETFYPRIEPGCW